MIDELIQIVLSAFPVITDIKVGIIQWIQRNFVEPLGVRLEPLLKGTFFIAIMNAILFIIIGALVVCLVALILGFGLITIGVAYKLELVQ